MTTFMGDPGHVVTFNPPVGLIKHLMFDENGKITTENEIVIARMFHHFDSVPADGAEHTPELSDDDLQLERTQPGEESKQYACKKCCIITHSRGALMAHYRAEHPKEE